MQITRIHLAAAALAAAIGAALAGQFAPAAQAQQAEQAPVATARGEVRRIDAANGKITIKHEAISALELPAMSLVYRIDSVLLVSIKPGQQVTFTATRQGKEYVVIEIK